MSLMHALLLASCFPAFGDAAAIGDISHEAPAAREASNQLPPLYLPYISPDVLILVQQYRLAVGSGSAPNLTPSNNAIAYLSDQAGRRAVWPLAISGFAESFYEGRKRAYGARLQITVNQYLRLQRSSQFYTARAGVPEARAYGRIYLNPSIDRPWFGEVAGGVDGAALAVEGGTERSVSWSGRAPLRGEMSLGRGRILPIEPRIRLLKLDTMLRKQGILSGPIPVQVSRNIMLMWWVLRNELGYAQRMANTLQILQQAGLILSELDQQAVYAFGRIFEDFFLYSREQGHRTALTFGVTQSWQDPSWSEQAQASASWDVQLSHRSILYQTANQSLDISGTLSFSPSPLQGSRDWPVVRHEEQLLKSAKLRMNLPLSYKKASYDRDYNLQGITNYRGGVGAGLWGTNMDTSLGDTLIVFTSVGVGHTWFKKRLVNITAGVDADLGYSSRHFLGDILFSIRAELGAQKSLYAAPI